MAPTGALSPQGHPTQAQVWLWKEESRGFSKVSYGTDTLGKERTPPHGVASSAIQPAHPWVWPYCGCGTGRPLGLRWLPMATTSPSGLMMGVGIPFPVTTGPQRPAGQPSECCVSLGNLVGTAAAFFLPKQSSLF